MLRMIGSHDPGPTGNGHHGLSTDGSKMSQDHPEVPAEQAQVDSICIEIEKKADSLREPVWLGADTKANVVLNQQRAKAADQLSDLLQREDGIVFARADFIAAEDEAIYLGIEGVDGLHHDQLIVDYRSPIGHRFYQATSSEPLGIRRRRMIRMKRRVVESLEDDHLVVDRADPPTRQPLDAHDKRDQSTRPARREVVPEPELPPNELRADEVLEPAEQSQPPPDRDAGAQPEGAAPPELIQPEPDRLAETAIVELGPEAEALRARDALLYELDAERTGQIRHVVATIQADQDRLIRADRDRPLIVQGGPGTGKTIVGLHRAAQILYDLRQQRTATSRSSVLVVGPNRRFMDYVARVLPSLGESDVDQASVDELLLRAFDARIRPSVVAGDAGVAAVMLGHHRMATLIERAVWSYVTPVPVEVKLPVQTLQLSADAVAAEAEALRQTGRPYEELRAVLARRLVAALVDVYQQRYEAARGQAPLSAEVEAVQQRLQTGVTRGRLIDRIMPRVVPEQVVVRLRTDAQFLAAVAADSLVPSSQHVLLRAPDQPDDAFTSAELPLIDEARAVIAGVGDRYGHVIVDEAQDLSAMQWRAVSRRMTGKAITVLGDLAQGTNPWSPYSWDTVVEVLGLTNAAFGQLTLNYRVPGPIAVLADELLAGIDVVSTPMRHLRSGPQVERLDLADWVETPEVAARLLSRTAHTVGGTVGVLVPTARHRAATAVVAALDESLRGRVTVIDVAEAKGLEFYTAVVVDPLGIERQRRGDRLLYVALTRATKQLVLVGGVEPLTADEPDLDEPAADGAPVLAGEALAAVQHRGTHVQIIAAAGSGKTEVVAQRVAQLLAEGVTPSSIVAFTFTERAAEELKNRISQRVEQRLGAGSVDRLAGLYVGTIHAYAFRLLQQFVPRYETYDVLDDNQLTAFLTREAQRLGVRALDPSNRLFASVEAFCASLDVVENELMDPAGVFSDFGDVVRKYLATLERYRLLTFGQQIVRAVRELERPELAATVHAGLRHLIVDEYQDVNPAQERLIRLLAGPSAEVCVVGDDDQAIYQWRGSDVGNIVTFAERWDPVTQFQITTNRRSRPQIVEVANRFAATIPGRLAKVMEPYRTSVGDHPEVALWHADDELGEAGYLTNAILDLHDAGVAYRDIAVLVRGRTSYARIVEQFSAFGIPVQPGGRSGLFEQPEARVLGRLFCWLSGIDWKDAYGPGAPVDRAALVNEFKTAFSLPPLRVRRLESLLDEWKDAVRRALRPVDLVGELYVLFDELDIKTWDLTDLMNANRMGTLARVSSLLADYESVRRRARVDADVGGEQVGGEDRGEWYYKNLAIYIVQYAQSTYEGFDGEPDVSVDAVDLLTVHSAKGLEWPVVFVPSVTAKRFPSSRTGKTQDWLLDRESFAAARYEGSDADERRLFYVAMTRSRDWLSVSRHDRVTKQAVAASPYYQDLQGLEQDVAHLQLPSIESVDSANVEPMVISYSDMASYLSCATAYRLRSLLGFQPRIAPELGYGKAVHHVLRSVAERTRQHGVVPTEQQIEAILDADFFLPTANKPAHKQMKEAARRLITRYASDHTDDLLRVWETERPFELRLDNLTLIGRADVILDREDGVPTALAILDYKASAADVQEHELQLQVYAAAGRREGLDVRAAYVHDLKAGERHAVPVSAEATETAIAHVMSASERLRQRDFTPSPGPGCRKCEVRTVCGSAQR
jgi:DNA helicase-2/ATP-dependent DNA helicase PcrA